jgi:pSer/pThr/pTyr-binding forkhead associated (FHA) protein
LDIDPPSVLVRDLGSKNGTYLNGKKIESSLREQAEKAGSVVNHGDLLTIGETTFRVEILDCPLAVNDLQGKSIWGAGETATKDCPLPC